MSRELHPAERSWFMAVEVMFAVVGVVLTAEIAAKPSVGDNLGGNAAGLGTAVIVVGLILSAVSRFGANPECRRQIDGAPFGTLGLGVVLLAWPSICLVSGC